MSFDQDPNEQANISGADLAILIDELKAAKGQRDELLTALEAIVSRSKYGKALGGQDCWLRIAMPTEAEMDAARAAIDKAKGGAA